MAQTKKKRRRKHAGTQAGTVERRGRTSKPAEGAARGDSKAVAQQRRLDRMNQPPTWRGAIIRAGISAVIFAVAVILVFKQKPAAGLALGALMFVLYIPLSYFTDRFLYNRRQKSAAAKKK
jgi:hypothetical protein